MCKIVTGSTCLICNKTYKFRKGVFQHVRQAHQKYSVGQQSESKKEKSVEIVNDQNWITILYGNESKLNLNDTERSMKVEFDEEKLHLKIVSTVSNNQKHQSEIEHSPTAQAEKSDPESRVVTKLHKCPICNRIFAFEKDISDHLSAYHNMPMEKFLNLGLKVKEYFVSDLIK